MSVIATLRDIAVVLIALEVFVMLLLPAVVVYFMVKGVTWVQRQLRTYAPVVQMGFFKAARIADDIGEKVAAPVITASATAARLRRMPAALASQFASKED